MSRRAEYHIISFVGSFRPLPIKNCLLRDTLSIKEFVDNLGIHEGLVRDGLSLDEIRGIKEALSIYEGRMIIVGDD